MSKILQDQFWKSKFGDLYTKRNNNKLEIKSLKLHFKEVFSDYLGKSIKIVYEFGTNRGLNLDSLNLNLLLIYKTATYTHFLII